MEMGMNEYQVMCSETAVYSDGINAAVAGDDENSKQSRRLLKLCYLSMGLAGEAGEVSNKVKKIIRDGLAGKPHPSPEDVLAEVGDCLWYAAEIATLYDCLLSEVAKRNLDKLRGRSRSGSIGGSGDSR